MSKGLQKLIAIIICISTLFVGSFSTAFAAIAFDSASKATATTASTVSWTHTTSGTNRILFVLTSSESATAPTSVTYNGVSMTKIFDINGVTNQELWYLINPTSGANTVTITYSSSGTRKIGSASSYTGVKQTGQPEVQTTPTRNPSTASLSQTITTSSNNSWVVMGGFSSASNLAPGTATTQRGTTADTGGGFYYTGLFDNNGPKTPAGNVTLEITMTAGNVAAMGMVSIGESVDTPATTQVSQWNDF